jgi:hypothetical protein
MKILVAALLSLFFHAPAHATLPALGVEEETDSLRFVLSTKLPECTPYEPGKEKFEGFLGRCTGVISSFSSELKKDSPESIQRAAEIVAFLKSLRKLSKDLFAEMLLERVKDKPAQGGGYNFGIEDVEAVHEAFTPVSAAEEDAAEEKSRLGDERLCKATGGQIGCRKQR